MPFLRVIRDKRGYEVTYLMHWVREGTRQQSRILYVFRTPGGIRVGREALEPDVLKQIEASHPDIQFDWNAVFHNQQVVDAAAEPQRARKRPPPEAPAAPPPPPVSQAIPSKIEGATPDEQIPFLAHWHAVIRERLPRRVADPERQRVLLALAERLNTASWTDADQITAGLQRAAEALERLSHVFAKRRRRPKRRVSAGPEVAVDRAVAAPDLAGTEVTEQLDPGSATGPPDGADDPSDSTQDA